jgi:serine/threonine protein phosphatase PrpC
VKLAENCDLEVKQTNLDLLYSGCTGVFVIIYEGIAYCASLGDSRAVLGTYSPPSVLPAPVVQKQQRKVLDEVRRRRESKVDDKIHPVQLTQDQKPDDPEEHSRIVASGGRVQRLLDANGQRIGPYRVWESTSNSPGLAMSRSIGDMIGKQIGVISTPVCTKYMINAEDDSFLVLASDGVWDVMDNEDVVNFVECFREKCKKGSLKPIPKGIDVVPSLTCIAHLLCEEARVRWYAVVEDEDVMIDDISCIILEFKKSENKTGYVPNKGTAVEEFKDREGEDSEDPRLLRKAPTVKEITTRDPRRGSIVSDKNLNY